MAVIMSKEIVVHFLTKKLSDYSEGDIVFLNENGSPVEFYVAKHDYESGLNGSGRTLLVRKDCYDTRAWHSSGVNAWASCTLLSWLNGDYLNLLDEDIRGVIGTTIYYYTPGNFNTSVTTRSDAVFQLSIAELKTTYGSDYYNAEGTVLPIASTLQIAYLNGSAVSQWTRTPWNSNPVSACHLSADGNFGDTSVTTREGSRPVFTLPGTALFNSDTNEFKGVV